MSKDKEVKTNAMRILDRNKVKYKVNTYECDEFIDGIHIADMLGQPYESSFKTLVTVGKSGNYYVFAIPIAEELDMKKAAKSVGEKSVEMLHVKDINSVTGYIRVGCTPLVTLMRSFGESIICDPIRPPLMIISSNCSAELSTTVMYCFFMPRGKFESITMSE